MKNKIFIPTVLVILAGFLISCDDKDEYKEVKVTEVEQLYIPEDNKFVPLSQNKSASVYFEWEKAVAADNGIVYYDVLFDKENGDFSNPIYVHVADNMGTNSGATITHRVLNRIASLAGIEIAGTGTIKWTVRASRGLSKTMSGESHKLTITRLSGFDVPGSLYLTGAATEGGTDYAKAVEFISGTEDDVFTIFTELKANETLVLCDSKLADKANHYYIDDDSLRMGNEPSAAVTESGIYYITVDFMNTTVSIKKVNKVEFFMCWPQQRVTLNYTGKGIWKAQNMKPNLKDDDRYFYFMDIEGAVYKLGSKNSNNSEPPTSTSGEFFNIGYFEENTQQWDNSFKFPKEMRDAPEGTVIVDMVLYLNNQKFTNEIVKKY